MRHGGNRRQRLATKTKRANRSEIVRPPDLAGRVALDRHPRVFRLHPLAIVFHADLFLAAELDVDLQPPRAGVDGVLDELLDDGGGTLHDFAGGDLVREIRWETVDFTHWSPEYDGSALARPELVALRRCSGRL